MNKPAFWIILFAIVTLACVLRLYRSTAPIADWHSWRQSDTAAVARNFLRFGTDPFHPRYDDVSNIQSGKDNPNGWRMVEFPVYQLIGVTIFQLFHLSSIEFALRLVSIASSLGSVICIAILLRRFGSEIVALSSAAFFAFLPYSVYYGRTILPESLMVFLSLSAILVAYKAFDLKGIGREILVMLAASLASTAILTKPMAIFVLFPIIIPFLKNFRFSVVTVLRILIIALLVGIPIYLWRKWILQYPEGIASFNWLFNEGNIRFKPAWIRWLFIERVGKLIFGVWGTAFLALGLISKKKMEEFFFVWFSIIGALVYVIIIARGNVQHDYYQIIILPVLCSIAGYGFATMIKGNSGTNRILGSIVSCSIVLLGLFSSWYDIRGYYWINRPEIIEAGQKANELLPENAKVIAPYNGDTTFLYQTKRQGWPIGFEIEKKITQGATHYVTVSATDADSETRDLVSRYTVLVRNDRYAIIDLTKPNVSTKK